MNFLLSDALKKSDVHELCAENPAAVPMLLSVTDNLIFSKTTIRCFLTPKLRFLRCVLPSFLRSDRITKKNLPKTAYLDGLRGLAALVVMIRHFMTPYHDVTSAYGTGGSQYDFVRLPLVRVIVSGHAMLQVFFLISGYILSIKALQLVRQHKYEQLFLSLSSSIFRRGFRLYLPVFVQTMIIATLTYVGIFNLSNRSRSWFPQDLEWMPGSPKSSFPGQLYDALEKFLQRTANVFVVQPNNPFGTGGTEYDVHVWTIPATYQSSIVLFVFLVAFGRTAPLPRTVGTVTSAAVAGLYYNHRVLMMFLCGCLIADLNLSLLNCTRKNWHTFILWIAFIFGVFQTSAPLRGLADAPIYSVLRFIDYKFDCPWQVANVYMGSILCFLSVSLSTPDSIQKLFTTRFALYLGRISFALYIVHGLLARTVAIWAAVATWKILRAEESRPKDWKPDLIYHIGMFNGFWVFSVSSIWLADLWMMYIDGPISNFARYMDHVFTQSEVGGTKEG